MTMKRPATLIGAMLSAAFALPAASQVSAASAPAIDPVTTLAPGPAAPPIRRVAIFISDLHLGFGKITVPPPASGGSATEAWHPMEDFRWFKEFDDFLAAVERLWTNKGRPVDLVILGDFLEMWQGLPGDRDCIYDGSGAPVKDAKGPFLELTVKSNLSCNANDALTRAKRVLAAHGDVLKRLGQFAGRGDNGVTIVPGNHDAGLVFQAARQATLEAIPAPEGRVRIAEEGHWRSADGLTVAEHGHFIKGDVNAYGAFPVQCLDLAEKPVACNGPADKTYLERPWGEKFVQDFYDRYEEQFPIVDNITSEVAGLSAAINASSGAERLNAVKLALKFLLLQQSWRQFSSLLGPDGQGGIPPKWDIAAVKASGDEFFEQSLAPANPLRDDVKQLRLAGQLDVHVSALSEDEVNQICDLRLAMRRTLPSGQAPALCPGEPGTLGAIKTKLLTTSAQRLADRMEDVRGVLAKRKSTDPRTTDFSVYVYAHTHAVHGGCKAHEVTNKTVLASDGTTRWVPIAYNTGAWQRVVTPARLEQMKAESPGKPLSSYIPEDLPACFSMIVVTPESSGPSAQPWFWAKTGIHWNFRPSCPEDPGQLPAVACAK